MPLALLPLAGYALLGVGTLTATTVNVHYLAEDAHKLAVAGLVAAGGYYLVNKAG